MKAWREKMNAALGAAREAARQGNMEAAANYHQAALNRAVNRGTSQTIANVLSEAPPTPAGTNASPAIIPIIPTPAPPSFPSGTEYRGGSSAPPPPPPPKPANPWITSSNFVSPSGIKQADPDIVITRPEPVGPEAVLELNYEDISGMELINISRSDLVDGKKVIYSPIKNLSKLRNKYNPNNLINVSSTSSNYFATFGIDLIGRGMSTPYFDDSGDLVIEIDDIRDNELIEIDVDTSGTISLVDFS